MTYYNPYAQFEIVDHLHRTKKWDDETYDTIEVLRRDLLTGKQVWVDLWSFDSLNLESNKTIWAYFLRQRMGEDPLVQEWYWGRPDCSRP